MSKLVIALLVCIAATACTNPDRATSALLNAGYTDVRIDGYSWFDCGKDDTYADRFTATGPTGRKVTGAVCSGFFKGATIRMD